MRIEIIIRGHKDGPNHIFMDASSLAASLDLDPVKDYAALHAFTLGVVHQGLDFLNRAAVLEHVEGNIFELDEGSPYFDS